MHYVMQICQSFLKNISRIVTISTAYLSTNFKNAEPELIFNSLNVTLTRKDLISVITAAVN